MSRQRATGMAGRPEVTTCGVTRRGKVHPRREEGGRGPRTPESRLGSSRINAVRRRFGVRSTREGKKEMFEPRFDRWVPALPSVDACSLGSSGAIQRVILSYTVFERGCVLVARRGEVPCTVESLGRGGGEGATKRKIGIS